MQTSLDQLSLADGNQGKDSHLLALSSPWRCRILSGKRWALLPRKRVGLKEVAALAGTSAATVSRVVNSTGYASSAVRQRVLEAAHQLSYEPNLRARGLRKQSSSTVGLIIPNLLNAYYTALADAAGQLLSEIRL